MKYTISAFLFILITISGINAQDCDAYIPTKVGSTHMYVTKNKKDKVQSYHSQELLSKTNTEGGVEFQVLHVNYDDKKEILSQDTLEFFCKGNMFYIDMTSYLNEEQLSAYEDSEIEISFENIGYPSDLKTGTVLEDGYVQAVVNMGMPMTFKTDITDRKVVGKETITTEAGSFETFKVSETIISKLGFVNVKMSSISWIKLNVGNVRSESYDKKGNLISYTELISTD